MPLTTQQKLDEAKLALHNLNTGNAVRVSVDKDGSRVEFAVADMARLRAYIAELEAALAAASGLGLGNGPARFYF